ncbi:hypothetical protein LguiA_033067 [Lonicera macranthoides]
MAGPHFYYDINTRPGVPVLVVAEVEPPKADKGKGCPVQCGGSRLVFARGRRRICGIECRKKSLELSVPSCGILGNVPMHTSKISKDFTMLKSQKKSILLRQGSSSYKKFVIFFPPVAMVMVDKALKANV